MKNKTTKLTSAILALLTACSMALPVFAATEPPDTVNDDAESVSAVDEAGELPDDPDLSTVESTEDVPEDQDKKKSSDVPLFIGAGLALLTFGGVVLVCKAKGNK